MSFLDFEIGAIDNTAKSDIDWISYMKARTGIQKQLLDHGIVFDVMFVQFEKVAVTCMVCNKTITYYPKQEWMDGLCYSNWKEVARFHKEGAEHEGNLTLLKLSEF